MARAGLNGSLMDHINSKFFSPLDGQRSIVNVVAYGDDGVLSKKLALMHKPVDKDFNW